MPRRTPVRKVARRTRAPEATREKLLGAAFEEMHRHGYQGASLDTILAKAGVTKGALYHHFEDKAALGHAVIDEIISALTLARWIGPLVDETKDPISALQSVLRVVSDEFCSPRFSEMVALGCPLNNLAQEMSPLDEQFRKRVASTFARWTDAFAVVLERGRRQGSVRADVDPRAVASFAVAAIEGSFGMAKNARSAPLLRQNLDQLASYLESLRSMPSRSRRR